VNEEVARVLLVVRHSRANQFGTKGRLNRPFAVLGSEAKLGGILVWDRPRIGAQKLHRWAA